MQEGDALNSLTFPALALAGLLHRTRLVVPVRLWRGFITTTPAGTARAFCSRRCVMSTGILRSGIVRTRGGASATVLLWGTLTGGGRGVAGAAWRAAVFPRQGDADQPLDVAQVAHFLGARDQ